MIDYRLFHDESKQDGYWHGILLVPNEKIDELVGYLNYVRSENKYEYQIGIKNVKRSGKIRVVAKSWVEIGYNCLCGDSDKPKPNYHVKNGVYSQFLNYIGAKFIVFQVPDNHEGMQMNGGYSSKVETTFRMGLKGGLHYLFSEENPVNIVKFHFDGYEHHQRRIDYNRIVSPLQKELRSYCTIENSENIIDDRTSNHMKEESQEYKYCQLIQLTDLMLGSVRTTICPEKSNKVQAEISKPAKKLFEKKAQGYSRMKNSRWNNSFTSSLCCLEDGEWKFVEHKIPVVQPSQIELDFNSPQ